MNIRPTSIQTTDQMDILAGEWTITCDFELSQPHTIVFKYIAPAISFFYAMRLTVDDNEVYSHRLFFPAIHRDECSFEVEGIPSSFFYQFGIFGRRITVIVGNETIVEIERGLLRKAV